MRAPVDRIAVGQLADRGQHDLLVGPRGPHDDRGGRVLGVALAVRQQLVAQLLGPGSRQVDGHGGAVAREPGDGLARRASRPRCAPAGGWRSPTGPRPGPSARGPPRRWPPPATRPRARSRTRARAPGTSRSAPAPPSTPTGRPSGGARRQRRGGARRRRRRPRRSCPPSRGPRRPAGRGRARPRAPATTPTPRRRRPASRSTARSVSRSAAPGPAPTKLITARRTGGRDDRRQVRRRLVGHLRHRRDPAAGQAEQLAQDRAVEPPVVGERGRHLPDAGAALVDDHRRVRVGRRSLERVARRRRGRARARAARSRRPGAVPVRAARSWNAMIPGTTSIGTAGRRCRTASASDPNVL